MTARARGETAASVGRRWRVRLAAGIFLGLALPTGHIVTAGTSQDCVAADAALRARLAALLRRYDVRSSPRLQSALDELVRARELCARGQPASGLLVYKDIADLLASGQPVAEPLDADRDYGR